MSVYILLLFVIYQDFIEETKLFINMLVKNHNSFKSLIFFSSFLIPVKYCKYFQCCWPNLLISL